MGSQGKSPSLWVLHLPCLLPLLRSKSAVSCLLLSKELHVFTRNFKPEIHYWTHEWPGDESRNEERKNRTFFFTSPSVPFFGLLFAWANLIRFMSLCYLSGLWIQEIKLRGHVNHVYFLQTSCQYGLWGRFNLIGYFCRKISHSGSMEMKTNTLELWNTIIKTDMTPN